MLKLQQRVYQLTLRSVYQASKTLKEIQLVQVCNMVSHSALWGNLFAKALKGGDQDHSKYTKQSGLVWNYNTFHDYKCIIA